MKQFNKEEYIAAVKEWNKHHRIIGSNVEELFEQSYESILSVEKELIGFDTFVDVGAGSGILGAAWLERFPDKKIILIEPKKKSFSFLQGYFGQIANCVSVRSERIEHVSRETLEQLGGHFCCGARAFSSEKPLEELLAISQIKDETFFVFLVAENEKKKKYYYLKKLSLEDKSNSK